MKLSAFLGGRVSELLNRTPFRDWRYERSVDDDLDELVVEYVFPGQGVELRCDAAETVRTIFLHSREYGGVKDDSLLDLPFSCTRHRVLEHYGTPSKSGEGLRDPVLGDHGAWDRFSRVGYSIHVEYRPDSDSVHMFTLMRSDVVP